MCYTNKADFEESERTIQAERVYESFKSLNHRNGVSLMDIKQVLDSTISNYSLLNHPFYQAWSAGELPVDALKCYAREYGAFISTLPKGVGNIRRPRNSRRGNRTY